MEYFNEVQQFRQTWIWALITVPAVLVFILLGAIQAYVALTAMGVILASVAALIYLARLEVTVDDEAIHVKFFPFHLSIRDISYDEIEEFRSETYSPIMEFGGWGIRWRPGKMAYNVSGDKGVRITRENGREIMIGSQRPDELEEAIEEARS